MLVVIVVLGTLAGYWLATVTSTTHPIAGAVVGGVICAGSYVLTILLRKR